MAQNFIGSGRDQQFLMAPDVRDWLPAGHLAQFVIASVEALDLGEFYAAYRCDGRSRPPYDPAVMVALLVYAYAVGVRSARGIERRCHEDVAFRVIACNEAPDHTTIARFRADHQDALAGLFTGVLGLCHRGGLVDVGVIALDSTKLAANASGQANRSYEQLAREILDDAARIDAEEDALYGDKRGDELPEELANPATRRARIRELLDELEAERAKEIEGIDAEDRERERRAAEAAAQGRKLLGRPPKPKDRSPEPKRKVNTTDPDSRPQKGPRGFLQGYNAHAVATPDQIIIAAELSQVSADGGQLEPMIQTARDELSAAKIDAAPETVLADTGYWHSAQIQTLTQAGHRVLVPPDGHTGKGTRPRTGGHYDQMRADLATEDGSGLYRRRQHIIEPIFGDTKFNRKIDRFQRRGIAACRSEWRLITATHNLLKLWRATTAAQPA